MTENTELKRFYIVISQTGTLLSRILKVITKAEYNHASISFEDDLSLMYSFGRLNPYNPFWGGFVTESADFGTFKRFSNTRIIVLAVDVSNDKYQAMCSLIEDMLSIKDTYSYNYLGLCLAAFHIHKRKKNGYYCSEFVKEMLLKFDINGSKQLKDIVHPMHFLDMPDVKTVYTGRLRDFAISR